MRGDVVIVPFPFQDTPGEKVRPALVVQSDTENQRLANTVVAMITGNTQNQSASTILLDPQGNAAGSGLLGVSLLKCHNLATVRQNKIRATLGQLSAQTMAHVDQCLRAALDL